jgi:hypothetical protein
MADTWKWTSKSKLCFVTTGATAPFTALIESILSPSSLETLHVEGFTHLLVQYGTAKDVFEQCLAATRSHLEQSGKKVDLIIEGIDFESGGLQAQFKLVQQSRGLVVSHAGWWLLILRDEDITNTKQDPVQFWKCLGIKFRSWWYPTLHCSTITKKSLQLPWNAPTTWSEAMSGESTT